MMVSRRVFLSAAAAASTLELDNAATPRCVVLDQGCVLPESSTGYRVFASLHSGRGSVWGSGSVTEFVIVPGATRMPAAIQPFLDRGATVLVELFANGGRITPEPYFPYVEYSWPIEVKIREFAAVALEPAPGDQVIGTLVRHPVALRRQVGRGTLVLLGSPLGPVFLSGDRDARRWLNAILL
jgi:hypothetical protein